MYKKEGISEDMYCIRDDDGLMLKIAHNYMKLWESRTQRFIIADISTVTGMKRSARC